MDYHDGIDVSLEASSICVVVASGKIVKEAKILSEPEALIAWFKALPSAPARRRSLQHQQLTSLNDFQKQRPQWSESFCQTFVAMGHNRKFF